MGEQDVPVDGFGNPMTQCEFWSCNEWFRTVGGKRFCSRGCKQADSQRRSRAADRTRAKRKKAGEAAGYEDGHLYVIQPEGVPVVKVGYSKRLKDRFRVLQTAHYEQLRLVSSIETKRYIRNDPPDKPLHAELLDEDHVKGEWWRLTPHTKDVLSKAGFECDFDE